MVGVAEEYCRAKGCGAMDLCVLSLRPELPPLYRKLGYVESGVEEFHPARAFIGADKLLRNGHYEVLGIAVKRSQ